MASQVQITGGLFQDIAGNPLAEGYLALSLSQDAQVNSQEIAAGTTITVDLDADGSVVSSPAVNIWPNDVLSPANTFYNVSAYTAEGQLVWGPNSQQVLSTPSPFDIGAWVPGSVNTLNSDGNITGLIEEGTNVTITGTGTGTSPYVISSTGGGGGGVTSFNTRTGAVTLDSSDVTTALTYTPVNKAGDTMTGLLVLSANPTTNLEAATKQYVDSSSGTAITALTGDVTASGPGSAAATVVKVNGAAVPASQAYTGTNSSGQIISATTPLLPANNLSDVATAATARTNLGLGTMATENASSVAITGGTVNGTTIGATTAAAGTFTTLSATSFKGAQSNGVQFAVDSTNADYNSFTFNGNNADSTRLGFVAYATYPSTDPSLYIDTPTSGVFVFRTNNVRTFVVNANGSLNFVTAPTATSATAGSASSLPALPSGYLSMQLNGTTIKIPYYNN